MAELHASYKEYKKNHAAQFVDELREFGRIFKGLVMRRSWDGVSSKKIHGTMEWCGIELV